MNRRLLGPTLLSLLLIAGWVDAQVPQIINYQGRVVVGTTNFDGTGQFKFALVQGGTAVLLWKNDGSPGNTEPAAAVSLAVANGLYSVLLGNTALANMTAIPAGLWNNPDVRLRVWFNDGVNGSQLLTPDQRIVGVPYATIASTVPDNAITNTKISTGAVQNAQIATGAVTGAKLAPSAINTTHLSVPVAPTTGQILSYNGSSLNWSNPGGSSIWSLNGTSAYYNGGNVGIGTNSPFAKLDVAGTAKITGPARVLGNLAIGSDTIDSSTTLRVDGNIQMNPGTVTPGETTLYVRARSTGDYVPFAFEHWDGTRLFHLNSRPGFAGLYLTLSAAFKPGGGSWIDSSDLRLKQDIRPYEAGLEEIVRLRPVRFRYREGLKPGLTSAEERVGFIAQEVQAVIPEAVAEDQDGYLTFDADPVHWAGINAIQQLNQKLEEQRAENAELKKRLENIERRMNHQNGGAR